MEMFMQMQNPAKSQFLPYSSKKLKWVDAKELKDTISSVKRNKNLANCRRD
jgi:hypothetical protein